MPNRKIRVWDLPTRIVHWALVLAIPFLWGAAEYENWDAHRLAGYTVLGLVVFRLIWGFVGSDTSRFANFLRGPGAAITYARTLPSRASDAAYGHNPLGGWSVVAMLLLLLAQVALGLFAMDVDGLEQGPLADYVDFDTARWAAETHELVFNLLLALIALHVAAVLFYAVWKRRNLIGAMVTGRMTTQEHQPGGFAGYGRAFLVAVIAAAVAWFVANGAKL